MHGGQASNGKHLSQTYVNQTPKPEPESHIQWALTYGSSVQRPDKPAALIMISVPGISPIASTHIPTRGVASPGCEIGLCHPSQKAQCSLTRGAWAIGSLFAAVSFCRRERAAVKGRCELKGASVCRALPERVPPAAASSVVIKPDADAVAFQLCSEVAKAAKEAVAARGGLALAIPGGSILKMLVTGSSQLEGVEWDKGVLAYVNHKCVPNDDAAATHQKATELFLSGWPGMRVITMGGSGDGKAEAERYEAELRALPESMLPRSASDLPVFDLCLIGVGDDGHFGSLYPGREEIADVSGRWVLAVDMKSPPSITLSPAAMMSSKKVLVASAGVSEKYPLGKSEAMKKAIEGMEGPRAFPAQALRSTATYLLDKAAASALSEAYLS